ncbi:cation-transporting P-type ATPase, partial [Campylobacter jejuni]|nr:cation-transporting P-type ATPase [Campylobacter jejuni]
KELNVNLNLQGKLSVLVGSGLLYEENDDVYLIGNEKLMLENGVDIQKSKQFLQEFEDQAPTCLYFVKNKICL